LWKKSPELVASEWNAFFQGFDLAESMFRTGMPGAGARFQAMRRAVTCPSLQEPDICWPAPTPSPCKIDHPFADRGVRPRRRDLDRIFRITTFLKRSDLNQILEVMRETYCRSIGVEFMHIQEPEEREWLIDRMEPIRNRPPFSPEVKLSIMKKLQEAALFETFLHKKFIGQTRFSLEGGDADTHAGCPVNHAAELGVTDIILGNLIVEAEHPGEYTWQTVREHLRRVQEQR
jgi:2-oxoglutarate dehydrogenase E1 component